MCIADAGQRETLGSWEGICGTGEESQWYKLATFPPTNLISFLFVSCWPYFR